MNYQNIFYQLNFKTMMIFAFVIILTLLLFVIYQLIKINSLYLQINKHKELISKQNKFDKDYQFIKGLY